MPYKDKKAAVERSKRYYQTNKDRVKEYQKNYRLKNKPSPEESRANHFWHKYGITIDDYDALLKEQDFKCGICLRHITELSKPLFVDHDHTTNEVRGLLCVRCNSALGAFGDNIEGLEKAIKYLSDKED